MDHEEKHIIRYRGGRKVGYRWFCTCGEDSGEHPWAEAFDRTWNAHSHLQDVGWAWYEKDSARLMIRKA